jgi:VRR-NUC domain
MSGRRRRQQPEAEIQACVFQHYGLRGAPNTFVFHVGNGGYRRPVEAAILKRLGVTPGVPDVVGIRDGRVYLLELKRPGGRLTDVQRAAHQALMRAGAEVMTADSLDLALRQLEEWGLLRGTTMMERGE